MDTLIQGQSRSSLKKIYEKDESPSKCLILCVANVVIGEVKVFLELTDGWYSIGCICDDHLANFVKLGKVQAGTKLVTFAAELVNLDDPCSPLEAAWPNDPEVVEAALAGNCDKPLLKLHTNSTRRAKWDAKLGFHPRSSMPTSFKSLLANGGQVSELTLLIARKYPLVYSVDKEFITQRMVDVNFNLSSKRDQVMEQIYHEVRS
jgi:breast cancer 2 susceptibility protein